MEIKKKMKMEYLNSLNQQNQNEEDEITKAMKEFEQELKEEEIKQQKPFDPSKSGILGISPDIRSNQLKNAPQKKIITSVPLETVSSKPVKYIGGKKELSPEEEAESIAKGYEATLEKISNTRDINISKAPTISSYQDALRQAEIHNPNIKSKDIKTQYVFPRHISSKKEQNENNNLNSNNPHNLEEENIISHSTLITKRKVGEMEWEDPSLLEWKQDDYRIWVGDIGNDVTDELLMKTFSKYSSLLRAKVVRDKKSGKSKGYAFVSFEDPLSFAKALREVNGKYIGNRPCKLRKSKWLERGDLEALNAPSPVKNYKRNL